MNLPNKLRERALKLIYEAKSGHIGPSFSIAEIVAYIAEYHDYYTGPVNGIEVGFHEKDRTRIILSKGHAVPILYALSYNENMEIWNEELRKYKSGYQGHPDVSRTTCVDASTGSLGQGLSIAIGHAIANRLLGHDSKIFCILGDGEMQEGQVWEALMYIAREQLYEIIPIVDCNGFQNDGRLAFDWDDYPQLNPRKIKTYDIYDGNHYDCVVNDMEYILRQTHSSKKPCFIRLHTTKGAGVSFMRAKAEWHTKIPTEEQYKQAIKELGGTL